MNRIIELAVLGVGGLSLLLVAFLGFAAMSGAPLSELALIGPLFEEPETAPTKDELESISSVGGASQIYNTPQQVVEANMRLLGAYALDSPFTADELQTLAVELKSSKLRLEEHQKALDEREKALGEREELVSHQFGTLTSLKQELERFEADLTLRASEVERDESEQAESMPELAGVSKLFEKGAADELVDRLMKFEPEEAAFILSKLDAKRSAELLNAVPADQWMDYATAFSALSAEK